NDFDKPGKEAVKLRLQSGCGERPRQGPWFVQADVDLGNKIVPGKQMPATHLRVSSGEEKQPTRFQQRPDVAQYGERIVDVLEHLDRSDNVELVRAGIQFTAIQDRNPRRSRAIGDPAFLK